MIFQYLAARAQEEATVHGNYFPVEDSILGDFHSLSFGELDGKFRWLPFISDHLANFKEKSAY